MNIIVASGPVIIENNKVLLNKHGEDGMWKFVGGQVEAFDFLDELNSLEEACRREVKEEMDIEIEIVRPLKPMMIKKDKKTWVVLIHYLAKKIGEIEPGDDIIKWGWYPIDDLPEGCAPNIDPVLKSI